MKIDACYQLGHVIKPHGLEGDINILLDVDDPTRYRNLESVFVETDGKLVPFFIDSIRIKGNKAVISLEDVSSREEAEALQSKSLYLPLDLLPELDEGKFYYHQIIDYEVVDEESGILGKVSGVFSSTAQDLIVMDYREQEVLIPVQDHIVIKADHSSKQLHVRLPDGLLDIFLE